MINSADGGMRARVARYVEVDFEGLNRCNRFPNGGTILALASRRCTTARSIGGCWRDSDEESTGIVRMLVATGGTWRRPRATIR